MYKRHSYCRRLPKGPLARVWCDNCSHHRFVSAATVTLLEATHSWFVNCPACGSLLSLTIPVDGRGRALWHLLMVGGATTYEAELERLLDA